MNPTPKVYIFISNNPEVRGLSLQRDGENLPRLTDNSIWSPHAVAALTREHLQRHALIPTWRS